MYKMAMKSTKKGNRRAGAVKGARLAYDALPAKAKRKMGTRIGKAAGVQSKVKKMKKAGVTAKGVVKKAHKIHSFFQ